MIDLYPHQREVIDKLHTGSILWGGVGSGKSITALVYFCEKVCNNMRSPKDLLIITTARKRDTEEWEGECAKLDILAKGVRVKIDSWNNIEKHIHTHGQFVIFDEQRVTGRGPWVIAFYKLAKENDWILLSATPGDRWTEYIPVFIANGFYKNRTEFIRRHVIYSPYITKYPKIIGYMDLSVLEKHRNDILVGMHYEKKTTRHHEQIMVSYDKDLYNSIAKTRWDPWRDEPIQNASGFCYALRRAVNSSPVRIDTIREIMFKKPKVIIFYNYNYELNLLRTLGCHYAEWNGQKHEPIPDEKRWAYLVQYSAGAEGWNCVSTDTIIFFSRSFSYKMMEQARGRIDRINTAYKDLYYYYLLSDSLMDKRLTRALEEKGDFNEVDFAQEYNVK